MAQVIGGAVAGAIAGAASAGAAVATGTVAVASATAYIATSAAVSAGIGALLGIPAQIEADIKASEAARRLGKDKPDTSRNVTAAALEGAHAYGVTKVGGGIAFLNASRIKLADNTSFKFADKNYRDPTIAWGEQQFGVDINGRVTANSSLGEITERHVKYVGLKTNRQHAYGFTFDDGDVLPSRRPYMNVAMLLSKGSCDSIQGIYINGELIETKRIGLSGRCRRGRRLQKSGAVHIPWYTDPTAAEYTAGNWTGNRFYPEYQQLSGGVRAGGFFNPSGGIDGGSDFAVRNDKAIYSATWPLFQIFEYFKADGTEGFSLFNATDSIDNDDANNTFINRMNKHVLSNGSLHNVLNGFSWIHIYMDAIPQASAYNYYTDAEERGNDDNAHQRNGLASERAFTGIPQIEVLMGGKRIKLDYAMGHIPFYLNGSSNPAIIANDYIVNVQGFPQESVDQATLRRSVSRCRDLVTITAKDWKKAGGSDTLWKQYSKQDFSNDNSQITTPRFDAGGVIYEGEDSSDVYAELAFAMGGGSITESGGKWYIRAGEDVEPVDTITDAMVLDNWAVQSSPSSQDRTNTLYMGLQQSKISRTTDEAKLYLPTQLKKRVNESAKKRDNNTERAQDLGNRRFVNNPLIAQRLMAIQLRKFEANKVYSTRILPGPNLEWFDRVPGEIVAINDPVVGLDVKKAEIIGITILENMSVSIILRNSEDSNGVSIYEDTLDLPPVAEPTLVHPVVNAPVTAGDITSAQDATRTRPTGPTVRGWDSDTLVKAGELDLSLRNYVLSQAGRFDIIQNANIFGYYEPKSRVGYATANTNNRPTYGTIWTKLNTAFFNSLGAQMSRVISRKGSHIMMATGFYQISQGSELRPITHIVKLRGGRIEVRSGSDRLFYCSSGTTQRSGVYRLHIVA